MFPIDVHGYLGFVYPKKQPCWSRAGARVDSCILCSFMVLTKLTSFLRHLDLRCLIKTSTGCCSKNKRSNDKAEEPCDARKLNFN